jgi:hypothetical protein
MSDEKENTSDVPDLMVPPNPEQEEFPFHIAMIINGCVYQTLNVDGDHAAMLLAQPTYIRVKKNEAKLGWKYDPETKTFVRPVYDPETDTFQY